MQAASAVSAAIRAASASRDIRSSVAPSEVAAARSRLAVAAAARAVVLTSLISMSQSRAAASASSADFAELYAVRKCACAASFSRRGPTADPRPPPRPPRGSCARRRSAAPGGWHRPPRPPRPGPGPRGSQRSAAIRRSAAHGSLASSDRIGHRTAATADLGAAASAGVPGTRLARHVSSFAGRGPVDVVRRRRPGDRSLEHGDRRPDAERLEIERRHPRLGRRSDTDPIRPHGRGDGADLQGGQHGIVAAADRDPDQGTDRAGRPAWVDEREGRADRGRTGTRTGRDRQRTDRGRAGGQRGRGEDADAGARPNGRSTIDARIRRRDLVEPAVRRAAAGGFAPGPG